MQHIHLKHVTQLMKLELPNINITMDQNSMNKLFFIYVYKKSSTVDEFPRLFYDNSDPIIRICGEINLDNYPATSPQSIIYGDIPHCHVYKIDEVKYKVCHSLDRSFEWYFKNNQTSTFNPSMTLVHYVINMYKFLAEDDRLHNISNERSIKSFKYWKQYEFTNPFPSLELSYFDSVEILNNILFGKEKNYEGTTDYIDYIDKILISESFDDIILPIFHDVKRLKHYVDMKVLNFTKKKYYDNGIRKTSHGYLFTNYIPAVINSSLWKKERFFTIFGEEMNKMYSARMNNMIISSLCKSTNECYIYTIFELFSEIFQSIVTDKSIKGYKMKMLLCIYHIYMYIKPDIDITINEIINHLKNHEEYGESVILNLGVVIGILLCNGKNIPKLIVNEIFNRMTYRSIYKIIDAKQHLSLEGKKFIINDDFGWESLMWEHSNKFLQTIALSKFFYDSVKGISLEQLDESLENIKICDKVKKIFSWGDLEGINGFNTFTAFMKDENMNDDNINSREMVLDAFDKFNENTTNGNIINRWKYHGSYYSTYYHSIIFPSDIV